MLFHFVNDKTKNLKNTEVNTFHFVNNKTKNLKYTEVNTFHFVNNKTKNLKYTEVSTFHFVNDKTQNLKYTEEVNTFHFQQAVFSAFSLVVQWLISGALVFYKLWHCHTYLAVSWVAEGQGTFRMGLHLQNAATNEAEIGWGLETKVMVTKDRITMRHNFNSQVARNIARKGRF